MINDSISFFHHVIQATHESLAQHIVCPLSVRVDMKGSVVYLWSGFCCVTFHSGTKKQGWNDKATHAHTLSF